MRQTISSVVAILLIVTGASIAGQTLRPQSAKADSCLNSHLQRAPYLTDDRAPSGRPVSAPEKPVVPVIMVHGWTGRAVHDEGRRGVFSHVTDLTLNRSRYKPNIPRSLIGGLQLVPGADLYTFDYHDQSARWVTNGEIGPALGSAIECLYAQSKQPVIIVGHSMGGLAARFALTDGEAGKRRRRMVSRVITFGTPHRGSLLASVVSGAIDAGATVEGTKLTPSMIGAMKSILARCGERSTASLEGLEGSLCGSIPEPASAFYSEAGRALRYDSSAIRSLGRIPSDVEFNAIAGDTRFEYNGGGWFRVPFAEPDKVTLEAGDMIVTKGSALDGASSERTGTCRYEMNLQKIPQDAIGVKLGLVADIDAAHSPTGAGSGPCFHSSLTRTLEFANEALGLINEDITSRGTATLETLKRAWVPSACDHPAGRLRDGWLPGIDETNGFVSFGGFNYEQFKRDHVVFADLDGKFGREAAAMLSCNQGGVAWSQILAIVGADGRTIDAMSLGDISAEQGRDYAWKVTVENGKAHVRWQALRHSDYGCCSTLDLSADFALEKGRIASSNVKRYTEVATAAEIVDRANSGDRAALIRLAGRRYAPAIARSAREDGPLKLTRCYSTQFFDGEFESESHDEMPESVADHYGFDDYANNTFVGARLCAVQLGDQRDMPALLGMEKVSFAKWRARGWLTP